MPLRGSRDGFTAYGPVVDGDLVTGEPWAALEAAAGGDVDLVCGFTHEEDRGQGSVPAEGVDLGLAAEAIGLGDHAAEAYCCDRDGSP
ncbi:hypothetical protein [Streptomyces sp. NPDC001135]